jgi:hypothetical protein
MTRCLLVLTVWMSVVAVAPASLTPRKEPALSGTTGAKARGSQVATRSAETPPQQTTIGEFVLTEETEVLLNGKPCKYAEVPSYATIVHMELAADTKTVLQIHFRTRK